MTSDPGRANLAQDTDAASVASARLPADRSDESRHTLDVADKGVIEEGTNLLEEKERNE